jgi:hypothetical protein
MRIRPRVSLLTGSILLLLTLYVPFAWSCKENSTGLEYIQGEGGWPGLFSLLDLENVGRGFYIFTLAMAAFALLVLLVSSFHRGVLRKRGLIQGLFAVAGAVSLFVVADSFTFRVGLEVSGLLDWLGASTDAPIFALHTITLAIVLWCLRAGFFRRQRPIALLFVMSGAYSLLVIAAFVLPSFPQVRAIEQHLPQSLEMGVPAILYWIVPLALWYRFGLSRRIQMRSRWPTIRCRIVLLYFPAVVAQPFHFVEAGSCGLWGVPLYCVGVHLISLGYMQLWGEANPLLSNRQVLNEYEEQ